MKYSRPGRAPIDTDKLRRRIGGAIQPNAATAAPIPTVIPPTAAPSASNPQNPLLAGSEPSRELKAAGLTPEQEVVAEANRQARDAAKTAGPAQGTPVPKAPEAT